VRRRLPTSEASAPFDLLGRGGAVVVGVARWCHTYLHRATDASPATGVRVARWQPV
jgi:hypothetical protein